jgi:hypothetical protein
MTHVVHFTRHETSIILHVTYKLLKDYGQSTCDLLLNNIKCHTHIYTQE